MPDFKVSVVIPVYNAAKYIKAAVDSALMQPEVGEVILVEDKSPDNSMQVCEELTKKSKNIHLYQHPDKQNHGAGASRNLGITKAQSDYIAFLDADDYFLPNRFKKDKELFEQNPAIDGVYSAIGTHYYEEVGNAVFRPQFVTTVTKQLAPNELFAALVTGKHGWFHSDGITVKKKVFDEIGLFDTVVNLVEDTDMWIKVSALFTLVPGDIVNPIAMRGVHPQNRISNSEVLNHNRPILFSRLLNWSVAQNLPANKRQLLWKHYYLTNIDHVPRKLSQRFRDAFEQLFKYPFLLRYRFYYKSFPLLTRFIK